MFSNDKKQEFKTNQQNITEEQVIKKYIKNAIMEIDKKEKGYKKKQ